MKIELESTKLVEQFKMSVSSFLLKELTYEEASKEEFPLIENLSKKVYDSLDRDAQKELINIMQFIKNVRAYKKSRVKYLRKKTQLWQQKT